MRGRIERVRGDRRLRRLADGGIALALALASLVEIYATTHPARSWGGRGPGEVALALVATLPLAVRADFPIAVAAVALGALTGLAALASSHPAFEPFAAVVIAAYSVGAHTAGLRARQGIALLLGAAGAAAVASVATGHGVVDLLSPVFWVLAAWTVGRVIQGRRRRTLELETLARELEAQRDLQARAAVAVERGRIARELHDVVAHNVSMMVVQAGAAARVLEGDQPHVRDALAAIADTGRATVDEMRMLLGVLRSGEDGLALRPQPGVADLEQLVSGIRETGLPVELLLEGDPVPLSQGIDLSVFRIVQEALTNVVKHAGPARAQVTVRYRDSAVELEVVDDGSGGGDGGGTGHGLVGIRERVAMFGGELAAGPRRGGGFAVRARLPVGTTAGP
jgi:signal transduction histidine kinase